MIDVLRHREFPGAQRLDFRIYWNGGKYTSARRYRGDMKTISMDLTLANQSIKQSPVCFRVAYVTLPIQKPGMKD